MLVWSLVMLSAAPAADVDRIVVRAGAAGVARLDAPISVSVLDTDISGFLSPRAPAELLNRAPGVFVQSGSGREHLTAIRSPVLTGGAGAGSFLFLQDGVPLRAPGFANVNGLFHASFPFAERVEILRGPGDVAYGSNALHGAINVITPQPGETGSSLTMGYGSFDRFRAVGTLDNERTRLGLSVLDDGGYRAQSGADEVKAHAAARLAGGVLRLAVHNLDQETAGYVIGEDAYRVRGLRRSNPNPEAFRDVRHVLLSFERPFEAGGWQGLVTPYARWTDMEFKLHFLPGDALEENEHTSLGLQSIAFRDLAPDVELALGFDLDLTDGSLREFQEEPTVFSLVQGLHYDYRVKAAEAAPFAKLTWQASDRLTLQAGLRGTFTHFDYENDAPANTVGRFQRPADRSDDFTALTGKLAASYALTPDTGLYASLARGARPPQTTELYRLQVNQEIGGIEPETLDALELGWRRSLSERGRIGVTGFAMKKENVFFRDADGFNVTDGETTHLGVEVEASVDLTQTLTFETSATFAEHRYAFDRDVDARSETIGDGDFVDTAPRTLASTRLQWTPSANWRLEAAWTHVGSYFTDAANDAEYEGHDLLDLRVQRHLGDGLSITGILRNAADARYARRADFAFGNERYFPGEERASEVVLTAKF